MTYFPSMLHRPQSFRLWWWQVVRNVSAARSGRLRIEKISSSNLRPASSVSKYTPRRPWPVAVVVLLAVLVVLPLPLAAPSMSS
jgi:hypothetical protein